MAYTITKAPDGDISLGNKNAELFTLQDSAAAYPTGGYLLVGGEAVTNGASASTQNIDLWRIDTVQPWGGQGGYQPVWNPTTSKVQMYWNGAINGPAVEVPNATDLSAYAFLLLAIGS